MTSANTFSQNDILTSYSRADSSPTGIGVFGTANIAVSEASAYTTGTVGQAANVVTLIAGTWPTNANGGVVTISGGGGNVVSRDSDTQVTLDNSATVSTGTSYSLSSGGLTATFTQVAHGFGAGDRIVITGSESGTDPTVYNNNHTIAGITNSSTYTVTFPSDPTDESETSLTVRKIVTANVAYERILSEDSTTTQLSFENGVGTANDDYSSSTSNGFVIVESGIDEANATFANTGFPGNNAVIAISALSVGAIESVLVYNFGAGYAQAPTINASAVGDGTATLTGNVGVYAEYSGYFNGNYGLLSGTNKMQDNLYYQDFSYVIKTNTDVETYRDKILELVHPAGMAMFGEILMTANLSVTLFDNATRNISSTQANTALVANTDNVSLYNFHEVEFYTSNTTTTNNQILTAQTYQIQTASSGMLGFDARMDTTGGSTDFDLQLEHGNDLFSLEVSGFFLAFENTGELLLEIDISGGVGDRLIEETADFLLTEADIIHILLEEDSNDTDEDILLLDDGSTTSDNSSAIGALSNEDQSVSSPIIYEFFEADLGRIIAENDDNIVVDVLSHDTLEIQEYNGDFIVMEDGIYFVQEDEAGEYSQGFKIQQEGTFQSVTIEGNLNREDDAFVLLEPQVLAEKNRPLGLEATTDDAYGSLQETVYVELEQAIGGDSAIRSDLISHFVLEEHGDETLSIILEDDSGDLIYELGGRVLLSVQGEAATVRILNEEEFSNFKIEEFDSALVLEESDSIQLERSDGLLITEDNDGVQLEQGDSGTDTTPAYFLFEDDDSDSRAYLLEEPTTIYQNIQSEDPNDQFVIRMDDTEHTLALEREEFVTDTNIKGESYAAGSGFTLPMLLFPLAESGSALLDLSFTSRIVMEIDDIQNVRLDGIITDGGYITFETGGSVLMNSTDGAPGSDAGDQIITEDFALSPEAGDLHYEDDCAILYEQQETTSVGYQYDFILLEESDGTNPVYIATESSMTEEIDGIGEIDIIPDGSYKLILENEFGKHENSFLISEESSGIILEAGTSSEGEIIFEDGGKLLLEVDAENKFDLIQPHVAVSVRATHSLLESGDTLNEGSFLTTGIGNRTYGSVALSDLSSEFELLAEDGKVFISEQSTSRKDNLITEAYDRGVVATGTVTQFEFDFNNLIVLEGTEKGVINLEAATPEENSIILESDDSDVILLLQQEDGSKIFTEEYIAGLIPDPERLCHVGLHDLILEEEGILQEAVDQIKLEDFTLDNITQEDDIIGDFVPYLGWESHDAATAVEAAVSTVDNMLLESATHKTENVSIVNETGELIGQEDDETSHIVLDDFYFKYYSKGTITQTGTTITLSGSTFPSAVVNSGRFFYESGASPSLTGRNGVESTDIVSVSDSGLELTVENSTTISSAEHYKIEYGLDETPATVDAFIVMEAYTLDTTAEVVRVDLIFNGEGTVNHGYTRGEDSDGLGTYTVSIAAFADIVGNDVIYEDGERILAEDSIGGYVAFEDSSQNVSLGIAHSRVLNEDDTGCFISSEDHEGNETSQDDNVLMKEMSDALLLEDSETETLNYVLSEEGGQMMLEDVFQVSEYKIVLDSNDSILIEDQPDGDNWNYKLLNLDMGRFDISVIANNASMTIQSTDSSTSATDFFRRSDSAILVSRTEQIT